MMKKIVLIDEDEELILTEALKEINDSFKCFCAITAEEGIKLSKQLSPDYIFLDMNMPGLDGFECLDLIKKDHSLKGIPVIMYSTGMNNTIAHAAMGKGASGCVKKESSIKDLVKTLKTLFTETSLQEA
jgi:CheY-like chemotaxis protein